MAPVNSDQNHVSDHLFLLLIFDFYLENDSESVNKIREPQEEDEEFRRPSMVQLVLQNQSVINDNSSVDEIPEAPIETETFQRNIQHHMEPQLES